MKQTEGTWTIKIDPMPNFLKIFVQKFFTNESRTQKKQTWKSSCKHLIKIFAPQNTIETKTIKQKKLNKNLKADV